MCSETFNNKKIVYTMFNDINIAIKTHTLQESIFIPYVNDDTTVHVSCPIPPQNGIQEHLQLFWLPLLQSFSDIEIHPYLLFGGDYKGMQCVCCAGNFIGTFQKPWLGIPASMQVTWIRYHVHFILKDKKIYKAWYFLDSMAVIRQAGFNLFPQKGTDIITAGPMTHDGIVLYPTDEIEGQKSFKLVNDMLDGLCEYDGKTLSSMAQERFWDVRDMLWYGPSGIGTTRGLKGFQDYHQIPFLTAFPNRGILPKTEHPYFAQVAEGNYMCDFGFPSMYATHTGDGWLGIPATHKKITMRVADIWRRKGDKLVENWVMIDMIDILRQLGYDVFTMIHNEKTKRSESLYH